jgi:hypothetical protein
MARHGRRVCDKLMNNIDATVATTPTQDSVASEHANYKPYIV